MNAVPLLGVSIFGGLLIMAALELAARIIYPSRHGNHNAEKEN